METQNKIFDSWNTLKKMTNYDKRFRSFKERDIFYCKIGQNIGFEQNGKGKEFVRPVIILKKFNKFMFFGIPLSTQIKEGIFYHKFEFTKNDNSITNIALLSQLKLFSSNRLLNKIGVINKTEFEEIKNKVKDLMN